MNTVRSQSHDAPSRRNCSRMMPPFSSRQAQTFSTNFSRPKSWRVCFDLRSSRSTTVCVAMPAWSVPGSQSVDLPSSRARRMRMSWIVLFNTWPIVSTPVTLGGGITMLYASRPGCTVPAKAFAPSQAAYPFFSTSRGS